MKKFTLALLLLTGCTQNGTNPAETKIQSLSVRCENLEKDNIETKNKIQKVQLEIVSRLEELTKIKLIPKEQLWAEKDLHQDHLV